MSERTATRIVAEVSRGGSPWPTGAFGGVTRIRRGRVAVLRRDDEHVALEAGHRGRHDLDRATAKRIDRAPRAVELRVQRQPFPHDDAAPAAQQREPQL